MSKYHNVPTVVGNIRFDSKREANWYLGLLAMEQKGEVATIILQPRYPIIVNGIRVADYHADFAFTETETGRIRVVDVKGFRTRMYRLKKKLVEALYSVVIEEV